MVYGEPCVLCYCRNKTVSGLVLSVGSVFYLDGHNNGVAVDVVLPVGCWDDL